MSTVLNNYQHFILKKQFNLFLVTRGLLVVIHDQYILYTYRKKSNTTNQTIHTTHKEQIFLFELINIGKKVRAKLRFNTFY